MSSWSLVDHKTSETPKKKKKKKKINHQSHRLEGGH